ncbi:unnamed protein product [Rotaria sp. Silwood1]|nr:unnamed protein product [Rotaria sp. Silwood1]
MLLDTDKTLPMVEKEKLDQSSPDHIQNIIRIKNYLLILLVIQWFTCIVTFVFGSYAILVSNSNNVSVESKFLVLVMTLVIYYIFGLVITYQQHRIGLLIFASLGVIIFIVICILFGYIILAIIAISAVFGINGQPYALIIVLWIVFVMVAFVMVR